MRKVKTMQRITDCGIMAIVRVEDTQRAAEIADGCLAGDVDVMEISFTNNNAGEIIHFLKSHYQEKLIVGAGTVLDSETARHAILNGAEFIIAPTFKKEVAKMCNRYQIPYAPGITSYSEAVEALEYGASFVKAFPISNYYGPSLTKVFMTPLPDLPILASGGVTVENIPEWVRNGTLCLGVGSLLTKGSVADIAKNAKRLKKAFDDAK